MAAVELEPATGQIKRQDDARATRNKSGDRRRDDPSYQPNQLAALRPAAERAGSDHGGEHRLRAGGDFEQVIVDAIARWSQRDELLAQAILANVCAYDGLAFRTDEGERRCQRAFVVHRARVGANDVQTRRAHRIRRRGLTPRRRRPPRLNFKRFGERRVPEPRLVSE